MKMRFLAAITISLLGLAMTTSAQEEVSEQKDKPTPVAQDDWDFGFDEELERERAETARERAETAREREETTQERAETAATEKVVEALRGTSEDVSSTDIPNNPFAAEPEEAKPTLQELAAEAQLDAAEATARNEEATARNEVATARNEKATLELEGNKKLLDALEEISND